MKTEPLLHSDVPIEATGLLGTSRLLRRSYREHIACMKDVHTRARRFLHTPPGTPNDFRVSPGVAPRGMYSLRKNLFSTLFFSVYHILGIAPERRRLYGRINCLFRVWVTCADNLLDNENKNTITVDMPGQSHVMRQVVSIMAADRVLKLLLDDAVREGVITPAQSDSLLEMSLRVLLPSAAQEAGEECGVSMRPLPDYVLWTVHRYKTGLLFHIPFLGPEFVEEHIDTARMDRLKDALLRFGLGCQVLDDIRDMATDMRERRHNYVLSSLAHSQPRLLQELESVANPLTAGRIYLQYPHLILPAAEMGRSLLHDGLVTLSELGVGLSRGSAQRMANRMFDILDIGDLRYA